MDSVKPGARVWAVAAHDGSPVVVYVDKPALIASQRYGAGLSAVDLHPGSLALATRQRKQREALRSVLAAVLALSCGGKPRSDDTSSSRSATPAQSPDPTRLCNDAPTLATQSNTKEQYLLKLASAAKQLILQRAIELAPGEATEVTFRLSNPASIVLPCRIDPSPFSANGRWIFAISTANCYRRREGWIICANGQT